MSDVVTNELMLNPNLRVQPVVREGRVAAYSLIALVRGRGRLQSTVEVAAVRAEVTDVLKGLVDANTDVEVDEAAYASLVDLGVLVREDDVAQRIQFSCWLAPGPRPPAGAALTVNPELAIVAFDDFVAQDRELARVFEPCAQLAVVTDPVTEARFPYWLDERDRPLLQRLTPGAPPPGDLDDSDLGGLVAAGIVLDAAAVAAARRRLAAASAQFAADRYAQLPQLLPPAQLAALRSYYRSLLSSGQVASSDPQVRLRHAQHGEPVMRYYHRALHACFARVAGEPIQPSYGYFASYRRGATLEKHRDRRQCRFTASLLLDYLAGPADDTVWPIYLELPATGERVAVDLAPGDCLLFSGCDQPHYRHALRAERSTSFFLHYVDAAFSGSLQ